MRECSFLEMPFPCFGEDLIFVALVRSGGYVGENQECGVYGGGFSAVASRIQSSLHGQHFEISR